MRHSFDFSISSHCQAGCHGCARTSSRDGKIEPWLKPEHMDHAVFCNILKNTKGKIKIRKIQFCGELGDPMMHPEIDNFIDTAADYSTYIEINTNGGLEQPSWYATTAKKDINLHIVFGIDGIDHDTNVQYRKGVDFNRAWDNMTTWVNNGGKGYWHFILFQWNYHQIPEAVKLARSLGIDILFKINKSDDIREGMLPDSTDLVEAQKLLKEHWR